MKKYFTINPDAGISLLNADQKTFELGQQYISEKYSLRKIKFFEGLQLRKRTDIEKLVPAFLFFDEESEIKDLYKKD